MSIRRFYDRWPQYNRRLTSAVRTLSPEQLALAPSPRQWPIWAIVGHAAGTRVYWLCGVVGEPGAESTPFPGADGAGWEDDLDQPRTAQELVSALDSSFAVVDRLLDTWTTEMLGEEVERFYGEQRQRHSRSSILQRLLTHEAYHAGEISQTLGARGGEAIDLWRPD